MKFGGLGFVCVNQTLFSYVISGSLHESLVAMVKAPRILKGNPNLVVRLLCNLHKNTSNHLKSSGPVMDSNMEIHP